MMRYLFQECLLHHEVKMVLCILIPSGLSVLIFCNYLGQNSYLHRRKQQCAGPEWYNLYSENNSLKKTKALEMELCVENMSLVSYLLLSSNYLKNFSLTWLPESYPRPVKKIFLERGLRTWILIKLPRWFRYYVWGPFSSTSCLGKKETSPTHALIVGALRVKSLFLL